jgi:lipoprotein-releasing system ATP-binding protein
MSNTRIQPRENASASRRAAGSSSVSAPRVDDPHSETAIHPGGGAHKLAKREVVLSARQVYKSYKKGKHVIPVLRGVDFAARQGDFTSIVGQSGSGKSTLLHLLGTLDSPDAGEIHFQGQRIDNLPSRERDAYRNRSFGMIFQFYHLLPECNTLENVLMPMMIGAGVFKYWLGRKEYIERAKHLIELVGLSHRLTHKPRELSGGEMQRTAIARALMAQPQLLLADEPTGNLDQKTGREILEILRTLNHEERLTIVMVTHDLTIASEADQMVRLSEGLVEAA